MIWIRKCQAALGTGSVEQTSCAIASSSSGRQWTAPLGSNPHVPRRKKQNFGSASVAPATAGWSAAIAAGTRVRGPRRSTRAPFVDME
ncbi:hypothetical protein [Rhodanobacter fulvus]|jgi:hypothetical protein|uniref:hypothetical protein n=1 Tax=Rhodanobacter fulvus TaxID=219571 RepID=UPI0012EA728F|nr:hypothetical protein [Rhodanobacter fulvus]